MKDFVGISVTLTIVALVLWIQLKVSKKRRLKKSKLKSTPFKKRLSKELSSNYNEKNFVVNLSHKDKFLFQIIDRRMLIENHKNQFGYAICFYPEDDKKREFDKFKNSQFFMNFKAIENEGFPVYVADLMTDTYLTTELTTKIIQSVFSLSSREIDVI